MTVSLSPIGGAASQFFNANGVPLSGGKIYTYEAGTTTPKATYTEANGLTAHTNPIILDSAGRVPGGEIWLTSGQAYLFILKTSSEELIGTWDNIYGYAAGTAEAVTEVQVATAGQTDFVLTMMIYTPGSNTLQVFVDGVNQVVSNAYTEVSATTVTFVSGLHLGAVVKFVSVNSAATDATLVIYTPAGTGGEDISVQGKLRQSVSVLDFIPAAEHAAIYAGNSTYDCSPAITAALASLNYYSSNNIGDYYGYNGKLVFPETKGVFNLGSTLTITSSYTNIDFGGAILKPTVGFNQATFALNFTDCWQAWVDNINLAGFTNNIKLFNNNLNSGNIEFDNVTITHGDLAFDIECRSSFVRIMNYRFIDVKKAAYIRNGDRVQFLKGWYSAGVIAANYGGLFELNSVDSGAPTLELVDCFLVPTPQTVVKPCVVKINTLARVIIERGLFGGESGAMTLINNFAQAVGYTTRGVRLTISNTMFFTASNPVVRLFALPNSVSFHNCNGSFDQSHVYGLIAYDPAFVSFAASKALLESYFACSITITGLVPTAYKGLSRNEIGQLAQYVNTPPQIIYNRVTSVTNVISATILELGPNELRRGGIWNIKLNNSSNPGADRYSEYILSGDSAGTGLSLVARIEGASTVAPRVAISGSTFVIFNNSSGANNFEYSLEKLTTPCEQYL